MLITEQGGFEPPVPGWVQLLSREPDSATLAPLQSITCLSYRFYMYTYQRNVPSCYITEQGGFEPPVPRGTTVFKTAALNHSATAPNRKYNSG